MSRYDLILKNGTCVLTDKNGALHTENIDIGVVNGKIQALGLDASAKAESEFDAKHLVVLPGIIDSQVHFREPGLEYKEDLYTGTLSAVAGGVTSIFEMPNTKPNTSNQFRLDEKLALAASKAKCDYAFFVGATRDNVSELDRIAETPGCVGIKIFMGSSTGDLLVAEDVHLENILRSTTKPIAVHCEDEELLKARKSIAEKGAHPRFHPRWRNVATALRATQRIVSLAEKVGRKVHVLHITSAEELDFLKNKKHAATVECLPQHLTLHAPECYDTLGTYAQMNPPIREKRHQEALWKAINDGIVDVLGSDHAPHTRYEKDQPYPHTPSGMTGVQTLVPIMLNHVSKGRLSLERFVQMASLNPARIYNARDKGGIIVGNDADFTIVDLKLKKTIENSWIKSKCGWSPYDGMSVTGWPKATFVRGQLAMHEDAIFANAIGQAVFFNR